MKLRQAKGRTVSKLHSMVMNKDPIIAVAVKREEYVDIKDIIWQLTINGLEGNMSLDEMNRKIHNLDRSRKPDVRKWLKSTKSYNDNQYFDDLS